MTTATEYKVRLRNSTGHPFQEQFVNSECKRIVVRAGRRGGKTVGLATRAVKRFIEGRRQLYTAPTSEQVGKFWFEANRALAEPIQAGVFKKNESETFIEKIGTEQRIKGKTAWNADTLRGDYADDLYMDEYQLTNEDAWELVGAPMLLDNNGNAVFVYTPPSLRTAGVSKARDPRHAAKMFRSASDDKTGRWEAIHFTSHDNPHISREALGEIVQDMSTQSYRQEILAEDDDIQLSWLVYSKFNERVCTISRFPIPKEWLIYSGHDFGQANPACLFLAQNPATGDFYAFKEYAPGAGFSAAQHVEKFIEFTQGYNVLRRVGGNVTTEEEIRQNYTAHGWPITAPKVTKVNAQVDRVIGLMELNKLFIFDDLWKLLEEIFNCLWELDNEGRITNKIKNEARYHLLACLRYIGSDFVPETVWSGKESGPVSYI